MGTEIWKYHDVVEQVYTTSIKRYLETRRYAKDIAANIVCVISPHATNPPASRSHKIMHPRTRITYPNVAYINIPLNKHKSIPSWGTLGVPRTKEESIFSEQGVRCCVT